MIDAVVYDVSCLCATAQPEASVCAGSVGTLSVRHGARAVAQRRGPECHRKAGEAASGLRRCMWGVFTSA